MSLRDQLSSSLMSSIQRNTMRKNLGMEPLPYTEMEELSLNDYQPVETQSQTIKRQQKSQIKMSDYLGSQNKKCADNIQSQYQNSQVQTQEKQIENQQNDDLMYQSKRINNNLLQLENQQYNLNKKIQQLEQQQQILSKSQEIQQAQLSNSYKRSAKPTDYVTKNELKVLLNDAIQKPVPQQSQEIDQNLMKTIQQTVQQAVQAQLQLEKSKQNQLQQTDLVLSQQKQEQSKSQSKLEQSYTVIRPQTKWQQMAKSDYKAKIQMYPSSTEQVKEIKISTQQKEKFQQINQQKQLIEKAVEKAIQQRQNQLDQLIKQKQQLENQLKIKESALRDSQRQIDERKSIVSQNVSYTTEIEHLKQTLRSQNAKRSEVKKEVKIPVFTQLDINVHNDITSQNINDSDMVDNPLIDSTRDIQKIEQRIAKLDEQINQQINNRITGLQIVNNPVQNKETEFQSGSKSHQNQNLTQNSQIQQIEAKVDKIDSLLRGSDIVSDNNDNNGVQGSIDDNRGDSKGSNVVVGSNNDIKDNKDQKKQIYVENDIISDFNKQDEDIKSSTVQHLNIQQQKEEQEKQLESRIEQQASVIKSLQNEIIQLKQQRQQQIDFIEPKTEEQLTTKQQGSNQVDNKQYDIKDNQQDNKQQSDNQNNNQQEEQKLSQQDIDYIEKQQQQIKALQAEQYSLKQQVEQQQKLLKSVQTSQDQKQYEQKQQKQISSLTEILMPEKQTKKRVIKKVIKRVPKQQTITAQLKGTKGQNQQIKSQCNVEYLSGQQMLNKQEMTSVLDDMSDTSTENDNQQNDRDVYNSSASIIQEVNEKDDGFDNSAPEITLTKRNIQSQNERIEKILQKDGQSKQQLQSAAQLNTSSTTNSIQQQDKKLDQLTNNLVSSLETNNTQQQKIMEQKIKQNAINMPDLPKPGLNKLTKQNIVITDKFNKEETDQLSYAPQDQTTLQLQDNTVNSLTEMIQNNDVNSFSCNQSEVDDDRTIELVESSDSANYTEKQKAQLLTL